MPGSIFTVWDEELTRTPLSNPPRPIRVYTMYSRGLAVGSNGSSSPCQESSKVFFFDRSGWQSG